LTTAATTAYPPPARAVPSSCSSRPIAGDQESGRPPSTASTGEPNHRYFPPQTALGRLQIDPGFLVVHHLAIEPPQPSLRSTAPPTKPPQPPMHAVRCHPGSRSLAPPQLKVRVGIEPPWSPPPFAPNPGRCRDRERRQSPEPAGRPPPILPPLF
jgi:hypothetical protein